MDEPIVIHDFSLCDITLYEEKWVTLDTKQQIPESIAIGSAVKKTLNVLRKNKGKCTIAIVNQHIDARPDDKYWIRIFENENDQKLLNLLEKKLPTHKSTESSGGKKITRHNYGDSVEILLEGVDPNDKFKKPKDRRSLDELIKKEVIDRLKLEPKMNAKGLHFTRDIIKKIFDVPEKLIILNTIGGLATWLSVWYKSFNIEETADLPYNGLVTTKTTGNWFGISPGLPQLIVRDSELDDCALSVGLKFTFDECEINEEGRGTPIGIKSPLPPYPECPEVKKIPSKYSFEIIHDALHDNDGNLLIEIAPVALVQMQSTNPPDRDDFEKQVNEVAKTLQAKVLFEPSAQAKKSPLTYRYIAHWCLVYKTEKPLPQYKKLPKIDWFNKFPINKKGKEVLKQNTSGSPFEFDWMVAVRGRVHDTAHPMLLKDEKDKSKKRWLIIGDETGSGHEFTHTSDDGIGVAGSKRKSFAYIWVIVPPNTVLPSTPSDFHAMDQNKFHHEHLLALDAMTENASKGVKTLIFESPNFVSPEGRLPRNEKALVPQVIKSTLPLVLEHIAVIDRTKKKSKKKPTQIQIMSERIGDEWAPGTDSSFIGSEIKKWISNLIDRGINADFEYKPHKIMPKLDHPWMNYPDAIGFLQTDTLPDALKSYRDALQESTIIVPFYFDFLTTTLPELLMRLGRSPYSFMEKLCRCDVEHISAYMDPYLSKMIDEALEKFTPVDWRQLNQLMIDKQSTNTGRILAKKIFDWVSPKMPDFLQTLDSDVDRVNMCLTLAWCMDQQGGDVETYVEMIEKEWLKQCPDDRQRSFVAVIFVRLQNYFDFDLSSIDVLVEHGLIDSPIKSPTQLSSASQATPILSESEMITLGQIFSTLAFQKHEVSEHLEQMWVSNEAFINYPWKPNDTRRHCIYGGEFCLDYVAQNDEWFNRARQRLFEDFKKTLGTGENEDIESFWWPAAARFYTLQYENNPNIIPRDELEKFIQSADQFTRTGNSIVMVRTSYWLIRLSIATGINIADDVHLNLITLLENPDYLKADIYGIILVAHLIDLDQRGDGDGEEYLQEWLKNILKNSRTSTRDYVKQWQETHPDGSIVECLRFNYS
uniref:Uncharacterized protein n=1 Tax=uncultured marine group II/III euryarchaeote KM3_103_A07 TaxID=1457846 RepID=A0A075GAS1_9EURY|nr:hypothetical protein [uncultured marine group II/III euryarchaeote KM3_103_A07]